MRWLAALKQFATQKDSTDSIIVFVIVTLLAILRALAIAIALVLFLPSRVRFCRFRRACHRVCLSVSILLGGTYGVLATKAALLQLLSQCLLQPCQFLVVNGCLTWRCSAVGE